MDVMRVISTWQPRDMTEEDLWCERSRGCNPGSMARGCNPGLMAQDSMKSAAQEDNCSYGEQPTFTFPNCGLIQDEDGHQFQASACRDRALNVVQGRCHSTTPKVCF